MFQSSISGRKLSTPILLVAAGDNLGRKNVIIHFPGRLNRIKFGLILEASKRDFNRLPTIHRLELSTRMTGYVSAVCSRPSFAPLTLDAIPEYSARHLAQF